MLWEVGPSAKTEILVPLYLWPYEELYISNYNQTINFIGVGGSSFGLGYHILRDLGLLLYLGGVLGSFGGLPGLLPWRIMVLG